MGKQQRSKTLAGANLDLQEIEPLTKNQLLAFESDKNMVLHGVAGTGKTFISCYLAFDDMIKGIYVQYLHETLAFFQEVRRRKPLSMKNLIKIFVLNCFNEAMLIKYLKQKV